MMDRVVCRANERPMVSRHTHSIKSLIKVIVVCCNDDGDDGDNGIGIMYGVRE